ncbi:sensor histidine kinase [Actinomadura miaoliensis]|uniref:histidine kinase n=1 Tax=Actinomadura miaoliensis TaxID=430685 RepID=A0ABP7W5I6_9ACTN
MRESDRRAEPSSTGHRRRRAGTGRFRTVRFKVVLLVLVSLVSLGALWTFAASVTLGEGLNLRKIESVQDHFEYPSGALGSALQAERRATLVFLGSRTPSDRAAMEGVRLITDRQAEVFRRLAGDQDAQQAAPATARRLAREIISGLDGLPARRGAIDNVRLDRTRAFSEYTQILERIGTLRGSLSTLDNPEVALDARNQVALARAHEVLAQEDALLAGALAAGRMNRAEHAEFVKLVGAQRTMYEMAAQELRPSERTYYQRVTATPEYARLRALEDRYVDSIRGLRAADAPISWKITTNSNLTRLRGLELSMTAEAERRAEPIADAILMRVALAGALGLVAVVASVLLAVWVARSVLRDLAGLRREAQDLADERLPGVIARLRRGEKVDVAAEAPPLSFGTPEIDQVGQAFNAARRTAIQGAVEEAGLRQGISQVFVNLARRSQSLLHRQLKLLDAMERRISDPDDLEDLFRVDHLATRMRRHAEGLIILSGQAPGRGWRNPVAVIDVARAAASEVEDYTRVQVSPMPRASVAGAAVADLIHLLAELIENATIFSPPHTTVSVTGQAVAHGFSLEIEDRGLSMKPPELAEANERLANPPEFDLSNSTQLGLFVVGRLAQRHGIKVTLRTSPFGGMTAIVLLPEEIVVHEGQGTPAGDAPFALTRRAEDALVTAGVVRGHRERPALTAGGAVGAVGGIGALGGEQPSLDGPPPRPTPDNAQPPRDVPGREQPPRHARTVPPAPGAPGAPPAPFEDPLNDPLTGPLPTVGAPAAPAPEPQSPAAPPPDAWPELPPETRPEAQKEPRKEPRKEPPPRRRAKGGRPSLPKRVRQANLAPQLREETAPPAAPPPDQGRVRPERSPEAARAMMSAIQRGTRRGRSETAGPGEES